MGIQGLAARIKSTDGVEEDLRGFTCHVDCASMFFGIVHSHGFHLDVAFAAKNARRQVASPDIPTSASTPPSTTIPKRPGTDEASLHRKRARVDPSSQSTPYGIVAAMQDMLAERPSQIRFNQDGSLEANDAEERSVDYRSLGKTIDRILVSYLSKDHTTLHFDGSRSLEKELAHRKRDQTLETRVGKLEKDYDGGRIRNTTQLYKRVKASYRVPASAIRDVITQLHESGWKICQCTHQSDTCIANRVTNAHSPDNVRIITKDSDFMAYESVTTITMPVGRPLTWTTFSKQALLDELELQTPAHLVLVSVLTTNDYTAGMPLYQLASNMAKVRQLVTGSSNVASKDDQAKWIYQQIEEYVRAIHQTAEESKAAAIASCEKRLRRIADPSSVKAHQKDLRRIVTANKQLSVLANSYDNAVKAFVHCEETALNAAGNIPTLDIHRRLLSIVNKVELKKAKRSWDRFTLGPAKPPHTEPPLAPPAPIAESDHKAPSTDAADSSTSVQPVPDPSRAQKREQKRQRKKAKRKQERRKKKWEKSRFRSRTDLNDRYLPQTVALETASPIDDVELAHLTPSTPKKPKPRKPTTKSDRPPISPVKKTRKKELPIPTSPTAGPKALKKSFKSAFATVTLTMGSLRGCLLRATDLSKEESTLVVQRLDEAVSVTSSAKHYVLKMMEMRILRHLIDSTGDEFLENVLDSKSDWLERFVQNLLSFVLRGSSDMKGGRRPVKDQSKDAVVEAQSTFDEFKAFHPEFEALNPSNLPLSNVIAELTPKICLAIKQHYRKLPTTLCNKLTKLSLDCTELMGVVDDEKTSDAAINDAINEAELSADDEDSDDDPRKASQKMTFKKGHLRLCWRHLLQIPTAVKQPKFCVQAGMTDSFIDLNEEALVALLWGITAGRVGDILMTSVCNRQRANHLRKNSYGNVIKQLFVGDRSTIKAAKKRQTPYGKKITSMDERSNTLPDVYGQLVLEQYNKRRINHYRRLHNNSLTAQQPLPSSSAPSTMDPEPPRLPMPPQVSGQYRYALNNIIRTDGHELQILGYDLFKPRKSTRYKEFMRRIETLYPDKDSLVAEFGQDLESVVVIGIDPGEVVSGAFCVTLPGERVVNLTVKRSSLYQPTLAFREWAEHCKRAQPTAGSNDSVGPSLWACTQRTQQGQDQDNPTLLPSLHDLQNALHPLNYHDITAIENRHRQYFQLEPLIHGFYSSATWKKAAHDHKKSKLAEMDLAVNGVLKLVELACEGVPVEARRVIFVLGNGKFKTGINLTSVHTTFLRRLFGKIQTMGYKAVIGDEYLSSTMCPTCIGKNVATRLAKPSMRTCACTQCGRWIHRDCVGAHNIATIGERYVQQQDRPRQLARPPPSSLQPL
ncbi:hypothetical protein EMPS_04109 [Entomortierella parvispora]|uniref:Cas12f1-like TNB domain-containing protein n=1 Tax=Entomortierella parvispora TaxID=205924 RepID=A0A9P3LV79_9FUNG|nr:hypothetical protein EMPS_04109 [Entomortierella parvispora]